MAGNPPTGGDQVDRSTWIALTAMALGVFVIANDFTALSVAIPNVGILLLSFVDSSSSYGSLVPGMIVLGVGVGLFYSAITTIAVTALDPSRSSLAGGIVYMCQIAGGAVGLGLNTALVTSEPSLADGIELAFEVDAVLALAGLAVVLAFIRRTEPAEGHPRALRWRHRAHA